MATDVAEMTRMFAHVCGQPVPSLSESIAAYLPEDVANQKHSVPPKSDEDIPYERPKGTDYCEMANTLLTEDLPTGTFIFKVYDDRGVLPGQVLSIGIAGKNLGHVHVKCRGSVHLISPTANEHQIGEPVRLITPSLRGQQNQTEMIAARNQEVTGDVGGPQTAHPPNSPRDSDVSYDARRVLL